MPVWAPASHSHSRSDSRSPRAPLATFAFAASLGLVALAAATCKPATDQGSVEILTVDDPFTGPPPATSITVQGIGYDDGGLDGAITTLAAGPPSQASIDLGTYDETTTESLLVTAIDSAGTKVATGETLPVELGAIADLTLGVFVQRTGTLSRMPSPLGDGRTDPLVSIIGGRYIFVAGGTDSSLQTETELLRSGLLGSARESADAPRCPRIDRDRPATGARDHVVGGGLVRSKASDTTDAGTPSGSDGEAGWAQVAGGATIVSADQSFSYVVGGTRTSGAPTNTVLIVSSTGSLTWGSFSALRLGATAAWVEGLGLVIEGGNQAPASDASVPPGVEYIVEGGSAGNALDYAPDFSTGAGMVNLGPLAGTTASSVLIVGGANGTIGGTSARVITVPCGTTDAPCAPTAWDATLLTPLTFTQAFALDSSSASSSGGRQAAMHAYRLSPTSVTGIPFRIPAQPRASRAAPNRAAGRSPSSAAIRTSSHSYRRCGAQPGRDPVLHKTPSSRLHAPS